MKKIAVLLFALCALVVPATADDNWFYIGSTDDGSDYYYNLFSTEDQGSYITGWLRHTFANVDAAVLQYVFGRTPSYSMEMWGVNKNASRKQTRMFQLVIYDRNDNVIAIRNPDSDPSWRHFGQWTYCPPNSLSEAIWQIFNMDARANQMLRDME